MTLPQPVADRLARLASDQRAAATAPPGPVLCVAPAGSGKTTTLVARVAWLVATGVDPGSMTAITFNKRAQEELAARLAVALEPLDCPPDAVRVRTFHALGREILVSAGVAVENLVDRDAFLRELWPGLDPPTRRRLDGAFSRLKLDLRVSPDEIAADRQAGPIALAFVAYETALRERSALDFDDLVARALGLLERDEAVLLRWRGACHHLLVDEAQDLDRSQLDLALLLAAPANAIFLVGDDDQSIYGWRLADVRRVLGLAAALPGLRRVDLVTNYRCPAPVVERAVRLVEHNRERFAKRIRPGPIAEGRIVLAADRRDETVCLARLLETWPAGATSQAILARTNRELLPAAAVALRLGRRFRAPGLSLLAESPLVEDLLDQVEADAAGSPPLLVRLGRLRAAIPDDPGTTDDSPSAPELATALVAWAAPFRSLAAFRAAIADFRDRVARLRADDAPLTLATVHGTKGLEWDHVAVVGMEAGRFPSARSVGEAAEPARALEEERRLAYVAWTRARRSLTLLYDPSTPSPFLLEAFDPAELGVDRSATATIAR